MPHPTNSSDILAELDSMIAGETQFAIWADTDNSLHTATQEEPFTIVPAWAKLSQAITIPGPINQNDIAAPPDITATDRRQYIDAVTAVIERLKREGGKSVISRTTCGQSAGVDWAAVTRQYFARYPGTFRFLYYSPQTAFWLGASPELLYSGDLSRVDTMSLAGTRRPTDEPWDAKNIAEHQIVTDFIAAALTDAGLNVTVDATETLNYGVIQHLCTKISAHGHYASHACILDRLSPTPALAGYPRDKARLDIASAERHERRCYSGYVAVHNGDRFEAYVNLRCVNFDSKRWCIYTGGGITAQSVPDDEWRESEIKASVLRQLIEDSRRDA